MKLTTEQRLHLIAELAQFDKNEAVDQLLKLASDTGLSLYTIQHAANRKHLAGFCDDTTEKAA